MYVVVVGFVVVTVLNYVMYVSPKSISIIPFYSFSSLFYYTYVYKRIFFPFSFLYFSLFCLLSKNKIFE